MKTILLAVSALSIVASSALADPIADRKASMKERGAIAFGQLGPIAKGDKPFDAAAVMTALEALDANAKKFDIDVLFPAGSESPKTSPKIWEDMAGFKAAEGAYEAAIGAAIAAKPQDLAAFQPLFGEIGKNCGACHSAYRM
ncbi:MAG: cytochrome c [Rhizobiaceae bacterium]